MRVITQIYKQGARFGPFLAALVLFGVSSGLYKGIQDNYLSELVNISKFERGIVEFFRETPGLLVVLILAWMYKLTESRIFKIGIALMTAGLIGILLSGPIKAVVVSFMVIFSFGEHIIMPVRSSISLDLARREQAGASLGITSSLSHVGNIAGYLIVVGLFWVFAQQGFERKDLVQYKAVFAFAAVLMLAAALVSLAIRDTSSTVKPKRRRFYFAKKFKTYYLLEVFYGARKQIFITFAPYVLIREYGADTSLISLLLAICAICGTVLSPVIGKLIDRIGYKAVMVGDTLILIIVCLAYGFSHRIMPPNIAFIVVCVNYVLDSIISLASMASNVYVQSIAESQEELTATLSTGISVNHVISIFIALAGGYIWETMGVEVLFTLSTLLGLVNSIYAATIKIPKMSV
ncbi:MFS transporter [Breznakiellaceae bacterium SP9]